MRARRLIGLVAALGALLLAPGAVAAEPIRWCGDHAITDRPDVVAAFQVHVTYAVPADVPDRFEELAPRIVTDLAGVDGWWKRLDPARAPRLDLAAPSSGNGS